MIYDGAVQSVAPPRALLPNVALRRRQRGEECCQQEERLESTHAARVAARQISSQRAWHEECRQSILSIRHVIIGSARAKGLPAVRQQFRAHLASVLQDASASCARLKTQAGKGARVFKRLGAAAQEPKATRRAL